MAGFNIDSFEHSIRSDAPLYPHDPDADWDEPTEDAEFFGEADTDTDDTAAIPYPDEPWDDDEYAD